MEFVLFPNGILSTKIIYWYNILLKKTSNLLYNSGGLHKPSVGPHYM